MSDSTRDLLIYGEAAAKSNSRDEARYYLEWALRTDADYEQQVDAWYWLSTITDDPQEKRSCLENVLAIQPNHPEARRDLAILEGRLIPAEMVDWRDTGTAVAPKTNLGANDVKRYVCPRCGGKMSFEPVKGGLFCQFCGHRDGGQQDRSNAVEQGPGGVVEQDWVAAIYTQKGHSWQLPTARVLVCRGCGATVTMTGSVIATRCAFCGAASVVVAEQSEELVEPGGVAPFAFGEAEARKYAFAYLEEQRFKPDDLDDLATFEAIRPVYLPFWTFDMNGTITYQGFTVEYEYKRVRLVPTEGTMEAMYDDVTVPATRSLSAERLGGLKFDTSRLTPYSPDLLADWPAEVYSVSLSDAAIIAHDKAHRETSERIKHGLDPAVAELKDVTIKEIEMSIASYKHVLLPVWMTRYTYKGESYDLLVNGQTGRAHGEVPRKGLQKVLGSLFGGES